MTLTKMIRLTIHTTHKNYQNLLKTYGDLAKAKCRTLRGDYDLRYRPTTQAIGKIVQKFKKTRLVTNSEKSVHQRFARSAENTAIVSESVTEDPYVSIS